MFCYSKIRKCEAPVSSIAPVDNVNDYVLYHSLTGMASLQQVGGQLPEVPVLLPGEAKSFVNSCRFIGLIPSKGAV
jgi:hypothetical protein